MKPGTWQYWAARAVVVLVVLPILRWVGRGILRKLGVMRPKGATGRAPGEPSALAGIDMKVKVAAVAGAILSWPVIRSFVEGTLDANAALFRIGLAMAFAYAGVYVITAVVQGYLPKPEPEPAEETPELEGVEDAVLVEETGIPTDDEAVAES